MLDGGREAQLRVCHLADKQACKEAEWSCCKITDIRYVRVSTAHGTVANNKSNNKSNNSLASADRARFASGASDVGA